jgi:hypothetical protein
MKFSLTFLFVLFGLGLHGQTLEELNQQKSDLLAQIKGLEEQMKTIDNQIKEDFPKYGWDYGVSGTVGANLSGFSNWAPVALPNSRNTTILASVNSFANKIEEKYFWRTSLGINLGWQKLIRDINNVQTEEERFAQTADIFTFNSLIGYRLTENLAASGLGEFRSNLLNNFNNPGFFDIGVGATWTPVSNGLIVFHPLNYNFIFSKEGFDFESSLGTKLLAEYSTSLFEKVRWRTHLSAFLSYSDIKDFSNYTWTNSIGFNAFKGVGIGIEYALRVNRQESSAFGFDQTLQQYFILGLTYSLVR